MDNTTIKFITTNMSWKNVLFKDIVERVALTNTSENLPYIEFEDIISGEGTLNKDIHNRKRIKKGIEFIAGDVLFGKLRPYLKNIFLANLHGIAIGDFLVLRSKNILPYILYLIVNSKKFMQVANISSGSKMPRADWNLVLNQQFSIPAMEEQRRIASYFQSMDTLIQTTSKKLASLKQIKVASLQSMFPQDGETKPRVRFKGFDGEWKYKYFHELYKRSAIKNDLTFGIDKIISVANMYYLPKVYVSNLEYLKTYNIMRYGDIAFEGHKNKHFSHGRFVENTIGDGIVSHVFIVLHPISPKYDLNYWKYAINNENIMGCILNRCTKSSTMMNDLVVDDFLKEGVLVPTYEEQQKIGNFFCNLDRQITLQTRRLEKLKQIKAACLDKMFV